MLPKVTEWSWESADGSQYIEQRGSRYHAFERRGNSMVELGDYLTLPLANDAITE